MPGVPAAHGWHTLESQPQTQLGMWWTAIGLINMNIRSTNEYLRKSSKPLDSRVTYNVRVIEKKLQRYMIHYSMLWCRTQPEAHPLPPPPGIDHRSVGALLHIHEILLNTTTAVTFNLWLLSVYQPPNWIICPDCSTCPWGICYKRLHHSKFQPDMGRKRWCLTAEIRIQLPTNSAEPKELASHVTEPTHATISQRDFGVS